MSGLLRPVASERGARLALPGAWVRAACLGGVIAIGAVGLLLIARRIAGGITGDLSLLHLVVTAVVAGVVVLGARLGWRSSALSRERRDALLENVFGWGGSAALVLVALGCSLGRGWDWFVWLPLVGVEQWQLRLFLRDSGSRVRSHVRPVTEGATPERHDVGQSLIPPLIASQGTTALRSGDFGSPVLGCSHPFEGGGIELQRVVRVREEDGAEAIQATLLAEFATGQRQATLHVAFCPPLERVPVIEMEAVNGADVELKVGVAYCHGVRVEVRLSEPAEEDCSVVVEMVARPQSEDEEIERG